MKIRSGFVSNSSSSSYVCEICYTAHESWDCGLSEFGMCECTNGHLICLEHLLFDTNERDEDNMIPSKACPVCQFKELPDHMVVTYLRTRLKMSKKDILKDIKDTFITYDKFIKFINEYKDD
jgi:hypothetical protein